MPARPAKVACSAPSATPKRVISASPRVSSADLGVVAEAQPVADAGGDADDVLQRPGQLDADQVEVGVDAEAVGAEALLHPAGQVRVGRWRRRPRSAGRG